MIIGPNFIIGHIPKTGGHALAVMMTKAGVKIKHPFKIVNNRAFATDEPKHKTIEQLRQENPDILNNRKLFLVMRRMPDWLFSVFWQFQVHTKLSAKGRLAKTGIGKTYEAGFKLKDPIIPPPELFCHSTYPDFVLKKHIPKLSFYRWLRIEHIKEDIKKELGIDLPDIGFQHSYTYKANLNPSTYWNEKTLVHLYRNNPVWAKLETSLYGKYNNLLAQRIENDT